MQIIEPFEKEEIPPAATSKSSTRGQVKIPHLTAAGRG